MDSNVVENDTFLCPWKSILFLKTHLFECERWGGERIQFLEDVGVGETSWRSLFPRHFEILLPSWFQIPIKSSSSWSSSHYYIWNLLFKRILNEKEFYESHFVGYPLIPSLVHSMCRRFKKSETMCWLMAICKTENAWCICV